MNPTSRTLLVLWPAFVMAGVLEMLVFVVVDPEQFKWFGTVPLGWSSEAIYSITFVIFWVVIAISAAITQWLARPPQDTVQAR